jgi:hypothetical protein
MDPTRSNPIRPEGKYRYWIIVYLPSATQGFFIVFDDIPPWFMWGYHIAFHTYAFRAFMRNEFEPIHNFTGSSFADDAAVLRFYGMQDSDVTTDLFALCGFTCFFQILFSCVVYFVHTGKR